MKIIKSFYLLIISICITGSLFAQEEKKVEATLPPATEKSPSVLPGLNNLTGEITTLPSKASPVKAETGSNQAPDQSFNSTISTESEKTNAAGENPKRLKPLPVAEASSAKPVETTKPVISKLSKGQ